MDDKRFRRNICMRDNIREKNQAMLHVLELFTTIMVDNVRMCMEKTSNFKEAADECINSIERGRVYCNEQLKKISKDYKMKVYYIPRSFPDMSGKMVSYSYADELIKENPEIYKSYKLDLMSYNEF